jgi:hypothetical protein
VKIGHARTEAKETIAGAVHRVATSDERFEKTVTSTEMEAEVLAELLRRRPSWSSCQCLEHAQSPPHRLQAVMLRLILDGWLRHYRIVLAASHLTTEPHYGAIPREAKDTITMMLIAS